MDPRLPGRGKEVKRIGISGLGLAIEREHRRISLFILLIFIFFAINMMSGQVWMEEHFIAVRV
jgi:hypothetical protein